jgi:excisionase family DNA binding protein
MPARIRTAIWTEGEGEYLHHFGKPAAVVHPDWGLAFTRRSHSHAAGVHLEVRADEGLGQMGEAEKDLLKVPEACKRLGIGRTKLYAMVRTGQLPAVWIGSSLRLDPRDLDDLIEKSRRWGSPRSPLPRPKNR